MILNKINNKRYIGQAVDLNKRWYAEHKIGRKSNKILQNAVKKYGIQNFEFIILEYLPPIKKILVDTEQKWLDYYKDNNKWDRLYNICPNAETVLGIKKTQKDCDSIRERNSVPVYQYDLNGNFIAEYTSAVDAESKTGISSQHISQCRRKKRRTTGGFIWLLSCEQSTVDAAVAYTNSAIIRSDSTPVIMCDKVTKEPIKEFASVRDAEKYLRLRQSKIIETLKGKRPHSNGYFWKKSK